jgi:hypothetical protein
MKPEALRHFNPATASIGDAVLFNGIQNIFRGCTSNYKYCLIESLPFTQGFIGTEKLFQLPLCYVEDKPVYMGDIVYYTSADWWYSMRVTGHNSHVTNNENTLQGIVVDVGTSTWEQTYESWAPAHMFSWTKPKVMVTKTGWINIYTRDDCTLHPTKEEADMYTDDTRLACTQITWQQEVS